MHLVDSHGKRMAGLTNAANRLCFLAFLADLVSYSGAPDCS